MAFGDRLKRFGRKIAHGFRRAARFGRKIVGGVARFGRKAIDFIRKHKLDQMASNIPYIGKFIKPGLDIADRVVGAAETINTKINDKDIQSQARSILKSGTAAVHAARQGDIERGFQLVKDAHEGIKRLGKNNLSPEDLARLRAAQGNLKNRIRTRN